MILIAVPLFVLTVIAGFVIVDLWKKASYRTDLTQDVAVTVGDLVHELQKERGMTAGFLTSGASSIPDALIKQREVVDQKAVHMNELLEAADLSVLHGPTREFVELAHEELLDLNTKREMVNSGAATNSSVVEFYTNLNMHLIETALAFEMLVHDVELAERAMALSYFQMAKDAYGIQRAIGAVGFNVGWDNATITRLLLVTDQAEERLRVFHELTDDASWQAYLDHKATDIYKSFKAHRDGVLEGQDFPEMTSAAWFDLATQKIQSIRKVEKAIKDALIADMQAYDTANKNNLMIVSTGLSVILTFVIFISVAAARDITGSMQLVTQSLVRIGNNELDEEISGQSRNDEIGVIARQTEVLRGIALEKRASDAEFARSVAEQEEVQQKIGEGLARLQSKELSYRIIDHFPDEFKKLRMDFNELASELETAMRTVRETSLSVSGDAQAISSNTNDLSQRTEAQANALERSTSALSEITTSVRSSAAHASNAEKVSATTKVEVNRCAEIVAETAQAMDTISKSSAEISQIAKVIEDIAFQTNLLALNAGVEAARAGEAGRGFAVVAGEVQSLAQRCSNAVGQIDEITARSAGEVKRGAELATTAGGAMENVNAQVSEVSDLIVDIAHGLNSQSDQLSEINEAVGEMENMTQSNVAMVEETTASSQQLYGLASKLNSLIGEFKLSEAAADHVRRAA